MADAPKPPPPPAPPAPPAGTPAPALPTPPVTRTPRGPILLVAGGCAALFLVVLLGVVIWLIAGFFGGGLRSPGTSPDLSSAESAAKSYMTFEAEREGIELESRAARRAKDMAQSRALLPWMSDVAEAEKEIKRSQAWADTFAANKSALLKVDVTVVEVSDQAGMKAVRVKVSGKQIARDGDGWKVADRADERTLMLTQIEGKWKISR